MSRTKFQMPIRRRHEAGIPGHANLVALPDELGGHADALVLDLHAPELQHLPGLTAAEVRAGRDELVEAQTDIVGSHGESPFP